MAYRAALQADDPAAAYRLLAPQVRQRLDLRAFSERWRASGDERHRLLTALQQDLPAEEQAQVRLSDGRSLELVRTSEGWRVRSPRPSPPKIGSADALLTELERALAERNATKLFDLMSDELRALLEQKWAARLEAIKARPRGTITTDSDRVRLRLGTYFLELTKRDGAWKISDFN